MVAGEYVDSTAKQQAISKDIPSIAIATYQQAYDSEIQQVCIMLMSNVDMFPQERKAKGALAMPSLSLKPVISD